MSLTLQELYSDTKNRYKLTLMAGNGGLMNIMNWVYVSEDLNTADFLNGGELVITTGVSNNTASEWLMQFVRRMIECNTAGLILNIGKYIFPDDITQEIIDMCEKSDFPLFTMPWEVHIYDISKDYYNRIFSENQEDSLISNAFLSIIHKDSDYSKSINILEDRGFSMSSKYCISIIDISEAADSYNKISYSLYPILRRDKARCHLIKLQTKLVLVCNDEHFDRICQLTDDVLNKINTYTPKDLQIHGGIGGLVTSLKRLGTSYSQASASMSMAVFSKLPLFNYNDMGFFKILLAVDNTALLNQYVKDLIGEIIAYDKMHNTNFTETLRSYLFNDGSIQAIASELFCHRNTVNYRIHTLKDNFNLNLDDPKVKYDLMTAFLIVDYLALEC